MKRRGDQKKSSNGHLLHNRETKAGDSYFSIMAYVKLVKGQGKSYDSNRGIIDGRS